MPPGDRLPDDEAESSTKHDIRQIVILFVEPTL